MENVSMESHQVSSSKSSIAEPGVPLGRAGSDLNQYPDDTVLTTTEIAIWLRTSRKSVRRLPLEPLALRTRERRFLAGDVKALVRRKVRSSATSKKSFARKAK